MTTPATAPVATPASPAGGDAATVTPPAAPVSAASGSETAAPKIEEPKKAVSFLGADPKAPKAEAQPKEGEKPQGEAPPAIEIKLPEGMKVDEQTLAAFKDLATKHKLTSEQASGVASEWMQREEAAQKAQTDTWEKQGDVWADELKKELGDKLDATVLKAQKAIDRFGGEKVREAFARLGIGNHPDLLKAWAAVGDAISEDRAVVGGPVPPSSGPKTRAEVAADFYSKPS